MGKQADELLDWFAKPEQTLTSPSAPFYKWFEGGKLNVSYNCLDRHVEAGKGDKVAFHWRGEEGEERDITYADLHRDVQRFANALQGPRDRQGRRGRHLPADGSRAARSRCSRARESALRTTWSSAASRPTRSRSGWSSPTRRRW